MDYCQGSGFYGGRRELEDYICSPKLMEKLTEKGRKLEAKEGYWMLNITKLAPENISHLPYLALKTFKSN